MCGIAGIYSLTGKPIIQEEIAAQIETIVHRGPNQGAVYISGQGICGLGVRRLSIIDVVGGNQPLSNEDNSVHLVYNGETYNYQTLRLEIERQGHRLKTHNDGEVLLHGYEVWGPELIMQKIRGMTAFALWDERRHTLFLGRDRFGIKPLYYAEWNGRLYFASEIKAILTQPDFPRRVNFQALEAMLKIGFVPGPATMFEGIYKLPAAHYLIAKDGNFCIQKYWQLDFQEIEQFSQREAVEQFFALLQESVQVRLMSEVPLGALLSGGLDSGTLVALVQAGLNRKLKTVSIGFEDRAYDEAALAHDLARVIGTDHHNVTFSATDFDCYPEVMHHLEEPQCSATAVPIYKLYQTCQQVGLTVVLTGEGSDELLGGYHWHKGDAIIRPLLTLPRVLRRAIAASPLPMSVAARRVLERGTGDISSRYQDWLEIEGSDYHQDLVTDDVCGVLANIGPNPLLSNWAEKLLNVQTAAPLHHTLWLEAQTRLVDFINLEVDKMSMAHSIEARVPFLDHKLWEFCSSLPPHYKLKGRTDKYLLRQSARHLLPEATRRRRKKGLASPYAAWLRAAELPEWAEAALSNDAIRRAGLFNPTTVQRLRQAHRVDQPNLGSLLMGVLSTQVWFECFID